MKKIILMVLAILSFALIGACQGGRSEAEVDTKLYDKGLELVQKMDEMAESEAYVSSMSGAAELREITESFGSGDYREPEAAYKIVIPSSAVKTALTLYSELQLPNSLMPEMEKKFIAGIPGRINALQGASTIAAMSVLTAGDSFVCKELKDKLLLLYLFEDGSAAAVTFMPGSGGAVGASCAFLVSEALHIGISEEELGTWLEEAVQLVGCPISKIG
jgi:hypothetical protein